MEARGIIDEVIHQKATYNRRSLVHHRLARRQPELCTGEDDGLFAVLGGEFEARSEELPQLFSTRAAAVVLRPSISALKRCITLLEDSPCPEVSTWESWLASQPLYDLISTVDGKRNPPQTIAEFITQESAYIPNLNDGVRVNIAPLQKAGLLAGEVLAKKDLDQAIADRVEWRADERRWCREGKLPQPGC